MDIFLKAYKECEKIMNVNLLKFSGIFPRNVSGKCGVYKKALSEDLSDGFWTGIFMLVYEMNGDVRFKYAVEKYISLLYKRLESGEHLFLDDSGFLYMPSCIPAYRIGGIRLAKAALLAAADIIASVFRKNGEEFYVNYSYASAEKDTNNAIKISALTNASILYHAAELTGRESYKKTADGISDFICSRIVDSTGMLYWNYDPGNGAGEECFVTGDNSRAISWALYGLAVKYRYTRDEKVYDKILSILGRYATDIENTDIYELDTTMVASVVCAINEISCCSPPKEFDKYGAFADRMLYKLLPFAFSSKSGANGLIGGSDSMSRAQPEREISCVIGDFFYLEALTRKLKNFKSYI